MPKWADEDQAELEQALYGSGKVSLTMAEASENLSKSVKHLKETIILSLTEVVSNLSKSMSTELHKIEISNNGLQAGMNRIHLPNGISWESRFLSDQYNLLLGAVQQLQAENKELRSLWSESENRVLNMTTGKTERVYTVDELRKLAREWDLQSKVHGPGAPTITELIFIDWLERL